MNFRVSVYTFASFFQFLSFDFFFHPKISFPSLVFCFQNLLVSFLSRNFGGLTSALSFNQLQDYFSDHFRFQFFVFLFLFPGWFSFFPPVRITPFCYFYVLLHFVTIGCHCWLECNFPLFKWSGICFWSFCNNLFQIPPLSGLFILRWTGALTDFPYNCLKNVFLLLFFQIFWADDWPVTVFSSVQYPFAACLLSSFPVFLSAFTEVSALGFYLSEDSYQGFSLH